MTNRHPARTALICALALAVSAGVLTTAAGTAEPPSSLTLVSSRVSLAGTSNVHAYTASTAAVRLVRLQLAGGVPGISLWEHLLTPGALEAFEIAIPAATLSSPREGLDKNMHKALKVAEHPDITFRLTRLERESADVMNAVGVLSVAGVEREVTLALKTQRTDAGLTITGDVRLLMTDFGITPPKAMLGMLKTDPKVTVTFVTVLGMPLT